MLLDLASQYAAVAEGMASLDDIANAASRLLNITIVDLNKREIQLKVGIFAINRKFRWSNMRWSLS